MSKVIIAIVAMFALMIFPGAGFWNLLSNVVGGGVAESFLYPIYGGLILLAGLVVGCTVVSYRITCNNGNQRTLINP